MRTETEVTVYRAKTETRPAETYKAKIALPSYFFDERGIYFALEQVGFAYRHTLISTGEMDRTFRQEIAPHIGEPHYIFHLSDECPDLVRIEQADFEAAKKEFLTHQLSQ